MQSVRCRRIRNSALLSFVAATMLGKAWATPTVFWLEPRSNVTFDQRVTRIIADRAGLVVLRATWNHPDLDYTLPSVVARFKAMSGHPVLSYSWANRYSEAGRSEADLLRKLDTGSPLADDGVEGTARTSFLDITKPEIRQRVTARYASAREKLNVDGFAVDLSIRTPSPAPSQLARRCKLEKEFCPHYAAGMDALFSDLRKALGPDAFIAYNGLFNLASGQLEDQARLLAFTNAVALEFFGMDPKAKAHSFSKDILPYLEFIPKLPADKSVLVFGRAPWSYTDYASDFRWQRYLHASFLLASRPVDFFKYHATFQVPTVFGRTGGMEYFGEWGLDFGKPESAYQVTRGIYWRQFARGLVAVAPDDGPGGMIVLPGTLYTPEGEKRAGRLRLAPGEGALLLREPPREVRRANVRIDAKVASTWGWKRAAMEQVNGKDYLQVQPAQTAGEHDILLDYERTAFPYEHLEIDATFRDESAAVLAVAEVDDAKRQHTNVIIRLTPKPPASTVVKLDAAAPFRSHILKSMPESWPVFDVTRSLAKGKVGLGAAVLSGTGYTFRRWSHLRLEGAVAFASVELSNPTFQLKR